MSKPVITIVGRVGVDPEAFKIGDRADLKGLKFSIAAEVGKNKPNWYTITVWPTCKDFKFVQTYIKKGSLVVVTGYQTVTKTNEKGYYVDIELLGVHFGPSSKPKDKNGPVSTKENEGEEEVSFL